MRPLAHILLLICTIPGILAGSTGGGVLCIGEDGRMAIERNGACVTPERLSAADIAEHGLPASLRESSRDSGCGDCWDVPLLSSPILPTDSRQNAPDHAHLNPACLSNWDAALPTNGVFVATGRPPDPLCFGCVPLRTTVLLI